MFFNVLSGFESSVVLSPIIKTGPFLMLLVTFPYCPQCRLRATVMCVSCSCSNTAGQWNQVFVQPAPEEEVHIGMDQDPRVRPLSVSPTLHTLC